MSIESAEDMDLSLADLGLEEGMPDVASGESPRGPSMRLLRKIPVRLTLEVGGATLPLADLAGLAHGSVVELDRLAGEPLAIKVNGAHIGRAEVVVAGENYGLKIVELDDLEVLAS
ncbi:flagellar motor switch protein FliN [Dyella koreensis]|uniref:Flagellar motor switch protein FliN n=1 Tax=Dyella koreensis TaxID=311235 RepID=A0ABW8K5H6_9GAMM